MITIPIWLLVMLCFVSSAGITFLIWFVRFLLHFGDNW